MNKTVHERVIKELARAKKSFRAAKILLKEDLLEDSISRAYYAVLHAAKAVLVLSGLKTNSHKAVRIMFSLHFVKNGSIEKEFAKILAIEQEDREISDYDIDIEIEKERAVQRLSDADKFIQRMELYFQEFNKNAHP